MLFQNSIGIDIRHDQVSLVHLRASITGVRLVGDGSWPLDPTAVIDQRLKEAQKSITAYFENNKVDVAEVYISISADMTMQRVIEMPMAVRENLRGALTYELDKYLPLSPEDVYLDAQIIGEDKDQKKIQILLMAIKKETLDPYLMFARSLGTGACGIETRGTAMANYLCRHSEIARKQPCAFIFRDEGKIELGMLKNGKLFYHRTVTRDYGKQALADLIQSEWHLIESYLDSAQTHLYIFSSGFNGNHNWQEVLGEKRTVEITALAIPLAKVSNLLLAPAYSLASNGLTKAYTSINFLPPAVRKKPAMGGFYLMVALSFLIVIAGAMWAGSYVLKKQMAVKRMDDTLVTLKSEISKINEMEEEIAQLEARYVQLNSIRRTYVPVLDVLKELTDRIPDNAYLREFLFSNAAVQVVGSADSATEIVSLLSESDLFKDVAFLSAITKDKEGKEQFRIGFSINGKEAN